MNINFIQKAIIVNDSGKVLLLNNNRWDLPGGSMALPELHSAGLRRIVKEQINIEIWNPKVIGIDTAHDPATDTYHIFVGYVSVLNTLTPLKLGPGFSEFDWFKIKDLKKLDIPLNVLEFVTKAANSD